MNKMNEISREVDYDTMTVSNDKIIPINNLGYEDNQKIIIFDDYVCEKNQREIVDYFIQGRHKNCSIIYLSQSFYKTPRDIRLNCSHYCIYDFPSSRERNHILISFVFPQFTSFHSVFHSFHGLMNSINWPASSVWVFIAQAGRALQR